MRSVAQFSASLPPSALWLLGACRRTNLLRRACVTLSVSESNSAPFPPVGPQRFLVRPTIVKVSTTDSQTDCVASVAPMPKSMGTLLRHVAWTLFFARPQQTSRLRQLLAWNQERNLSTVLTVVNRCTTVGRVGRSDGGSSMVVARWNPQLLCPNTWSGSRSLSTRSAAQGSGFDRGSPGCDASPTRTPNKPHPSDLHQMRCCICHLRSQLEHATSVSLDHGLKLGAPMDDPMGSVRHESGHGAGEGERGLTQPPRLVA